MPLPELVEGNGFLPLNSSDKYGMFILINQSNMAENQILKLSFTSPSLGKQKQKYACRMIPVWLTQKLMSELLPDEEQKSEGNI